MEWVPIVLEIFVRAIELCVLFSSVEQQSAPRTEQPAMTDTDNWKCPSQAQLAEFLQRSDARRTAGASQAESLASLADFLRDSDSRATTWQSETGVGFLSQGSPHPLWDRELDA